jgi:hypothetical protein
MERSVVDKIGILSWDLRGGIEESHDSVQSESCMSQWRLNSKHVALILAEYFEYSLSINLTRSYNDLAAARNFEAGVN